MTRYLCQGPECHTYKTQSRVRGPKGSKVLRTRFARCEYTPEHRSFWEDYFCDERCLHAWLKTHLNNVVNILLAFYDKITICFCNASIL